MKLYFLRHGQAGQRSQWEGDDAVRPLTEEGKQRMAREADFFATIGLQVDHILTSPLVRAYQTAEIVAERLNLKDKLVHDDRLAPGFGTSEVKKILDDYPDANAIMLVGHEPDFSSTISKLIGGGEVVCKKGGLACVNLSGHGSLEGELVWLIPPSVLAPVAHGD